MSKGDAIQDELTKGKLGAQGYFMKRVDMMLTAEGNAEQLHAFMQKWWPSFKAGLEARGTFKRM